MTKFIFRNFLVGFVFIGVPLGFFLGANIAFKRVSIEKMPSFWVVCLLVLIASFVCSLVLTNSYKSKTEVLKDSVWRFDDKFELKFSNTKNLKLSDLHSILKAIDWVDSIFRDGEIELVVKNGAPRPEEFSKEDLNDKMIQYRINVSVDKDFIYLKIGKPVKVAIIVNAPNHKLLQKYFVEAIHRQIISGLAD